MCKEMDKKILQVLSMPKVRLWIVATIAIILFFAPFSVQGASNSTNGTGFEQSTTAWVERANLSVTVASSGWVIVLGSFDSKVNLFTAQAKARILQDGTEISRANLTTMVYISNAVILGASYVTAGTYNFAVETSAPSGKTLTVYNWTVYAGDGGSGAGGGGANVSAVLAANPLCSSGGDTPELSICGLIADGSIASAATWNGYAALISAIRANETYYITNNTAYLNQSQIIGLVSTLSAMNSSVTTITDAMNVTIGQKTTIPEVNAVAVLNSIAQILGLQDILDDMNVTTATKTTLSQVNSSAQITIAQVTGVQSQFDSNNVSISALIANSSDTVRGINITGQARIVGNVTLVQGTNITLEQNGQEITISSSGGGGSGGNFSLNASGYSGLTDYATLVAGGNVTITQNGHNITISATDVSSSSNDYNLSNYTSGTVALARLPTLPDSQLENGSYFSKNISNSTVNPYSMNASNISSGSLVDARISSASTWNSKVTSISNTSPITSTSGTTPIIGILQASNSSSGYISSTDYNTLIIKEPAITSGTTAQFWRGNKTFSIVYSTDIGLQSGHIWYNNTIDNTYWITHTTTDLTEGVNQYFTNARAISALTNTTNSINSSMETINTAQNTSFQDTTLPILLDNGATALQVGYYPIIAKVPSTVTLRNLSLNTYYSGNMNASFLYNLTGNPVYPTDSLGIVNVSSERTGLSGVMVAGGNISVYIINNSGVTNITLNAILRRS